MASRPMVSVQGLDGKVSEQVAMPEVLLTPVRPDLVRTVHTGMAKNKRQAYAVNPKSGHQTSAESWGTGRAVSRIPRVGGGGTHRSGQGAFGNMCRGGRMFAPTKQWRRWHRKVNLKMKRHAVASSLAASAVPALVMARGHRIDQVPEVPLVVVDSLESITKTSKAMEVIKKLGGGADLDRVSDSKLIRSGKGKMRNRRYTMRRGPLIIHASDSGVTKAARNLAGVELCHVDRLNLLLLAPGGHMGRFIIWTKSAFEKLDSLFGTQDSTAEMKKGYHLMRPIMTNADLSRLINSDEVQTVVRPTKTTVKPAPLKKNPLKNRAALAKLNPYLAEERKKVTEESARQSKDRQARLEARRAGKSGKGPGKGVKAVGKEFYKSMVVESDYGHQWNTPFNTWLTQGED